MVGLTLTFQSASRVAHATNGARFLSETNLATRYSDLLPLFKHRPASVRIKLGSVLMILFRSLPEDPETGPGDYLICDRSWNVQLYLRAGSEFTQDRQFRSDLFGALVPTAPASRLQRTLRRKRQGVTFENSQHIYKPRKQREEQKCPSQPLR